MKIDKKTLLRIQNEKNRWKRESIKMEEKILNSEIVLLKDKIKMSQLLLKTLMSQRGRRFGGKDAK